MTKPREKRERVWTLADLELLARWSTRFYGSGLKLREPVQTSGGDTDGIEDERTHEWHRAATVHRRFEAMRTGIGRTHYAVLWFVIFERGCRSQEIGTSLVTELGKRFANAARRRDWEAMSLGPRRASQKADGQRLWDGALGAWMREG